MSTKGNNGKTPPTTLSKPPSHVFLAKTLASLRAAYPYLDMTPETAEIYLREMAMLGAEVGQQRLESAIHKSLRECKMFPSIAEIRDKVPTEESKPRMAYDSNCKVCDGSGWKNVGPDHGGRENRYARCECQHVVFVTN